MMKLSENIPRRRINIFAYRIILILLGFFLYQGSLSAQSAENPQPTKADWLNFFEGGCILINENDEKLLLDGGTFVNPYANATDNSALNKEPKFKNVKITPEGKIEATAAEICYTVNLNLNKINTSKLLSLGLTQQQINEIKKLGNLAIVATDPD